MFEILTLASVDKEKANAERKGPTPGRGSVNEPAAPSIPKKPVSSAAPASMPVLEVSDGSGNTISATNSPESSHPDGEFSHELSIQELPFLVLILLLKSQLK